VAAAVIICGSVTAKIGGMTLPERAVRLAHRAGLSPIRLHGLQHGLLDIGALRSEGVPVEVVDGPVPARLGESSGSVLIIGPDLLFGPALLPDLFEAGSASGGAVGVVDGASVHVLFVPAGRTAVAAKSSSVDGIADALADGHALQALPDAFCRRVHNGDDAAAVERDFIRRLNGRESYFTKKIRRFSVPLSQRLVRLGARPAAVTTLGFVLAVASAWCIAQGRYAWGVLGGLLYYASMVCDCSDGEVARLTLRDSAFGAWLETVVDYLTYVLLLVALVAAVRTQPGADVYLRAAAIALAGSVVVIGFAGYLRQRVAGTDPGQFDEASANAMVHASALHRFARWGRQWIKRSTIAHLVVALAVIGRLEWLLFLWAFGASVAAVVIALVTPFVVRRVSVRPLAIPPGAAR